MIDKTEPTTAEIREIMKKPSKLHFYELVTLTLKTLNHLEAAETTIKALRELAERWRKENPPINGWRAITLDELFAATNKCRADELLELLEQDE